MILAGKYVLNEKMGEGAHGIVRKASILNTSNNNFVALKSVKLNTLEHPIDGKRLVREIALLRVCRHKNIVAISDIFIEDQHLHIEMEFVDASLEVLLTRGVRLTNSSIRKLLFQMLEALDFLHSMDVVHRDIKPSNVLVSNNGIVKLCDFGLARHITSKAINNAADLEEYVCTRWYRPPELFWGWDSYGVAIDLWSLGCVVAEIINLKALFPGSNSTQQLNFFNEVLGYPSEDVLSRMKLSQAKDYALTLDSTASSVKFQSRFPLDTDHLLINLMRSWLQYDPALRLSAEDSLKHNYFSGFRHETVPKVDFSLPWDNEELSFNQKLNILSTERKLLSGKPLQMITPTKNVPELRVNLSPNTIKSPLWRESFEEWSTLNIPSADVLSPPSLEDD